MATAKIMEIFKDPVFSAEEGKIEMEEIDFWKEVNRWIIYDRIYKIECFRHLSIALFSLLYQKKQMPINSPQTSTKIVKVFTEKSYDSHRHKAKDLDTIYILQYCFKKTR